MKRPCKCLFLLGGAREPSLVTSSFILQKMKKIRIQLLQLYIYTGDVKDASSFKWRIDRETSHRIVSYLTVGFNSCCTAALRGQARFRYSFVPGLSIRTTGNKSLVTHDFFLPWACLLLLYLVVYCTRRSSIIIIIINMNRESMSFSTQRGPARVLGCFYGSQAG